jgi:putative hemolysin
MTALVVVGTIAVLIALQALYVAAEFATVSARRSRITQLAHAGDRMALLLLPVVAEPRRLDNYIAACQIGITASNLVLGFYGQARLTPTVAPLLARIGLTSPAAAPSVAATIVLLFLTGLQVVLGELVPKNIGVRYPERLALVTTLPMRWSVAILRPLIGVLNGSGQAIMRLIGLPPRTEGTYVHRPEEIMLLVAESSAGGLVDREERRMLENTLRWRDLTVRQAMVARTRLLAAPIDRSREEMLALVAGSPHSRLLVYRDAIDDIVGVVHLKDILCAPPDRPWDAARWARKPTFVAESASVAEVFARLQRLHEPLAIVLDEFGGTAGMVALDDLIEAIFGELQDEFDTESLSVEVVGERVRLRGDTLLRDLSEWFDVQLAGDDVDTVGGLVLARVDAVPRPGDEVPIAGVAVRVERMDGNAVTVVSLPVTAQQIARWQERAS